LIAVSALIFFYIPILKLLADYLKIKYWDPKVVLVYFVISWNYWLWEWIFMSVSVYDLFIITTGRVIIFSLYTQNLIYVCTDDNVFEFLYFRFFSRTGWRENDWIVLIELKLMWMIVWNSDSRVKNCVQFELLLELKLILFLLSFGNAYITCI